MEDIALLKARIRNQGRGLLNPRGKFIQARAAAQARGF